MMPVCTNLTPLFGEHAALMERICRSIMALPGVERIIVYGSYAKGEARSESDVDIAVFFDRQGAEPLKTEYRALARICRNAELDVQAQPFHLYELDEPCGIIDEVARYGVEIRLP